MTPLSLNTSPHRKRYFYSFLPLVLILLSSAFTLRVVYLQQKQIYFEQSAFREYHLNSAIITTELAAFLHELHISILHDDPAQPQVIRQREKLLQLIQKRLDGLTDMQLEATLLTPTEKALERLQQNVQQLQKAVGQNNRPDNITPYILAAQQRAIQLQRLHTVTHIEDPAHSYAQKRWIRLVNGVIAVGGATLIGIIFLMQFAYRADSMRLRSQQELIQSKARYKTLAQHRQLLLDELDHRVKNNLASLLALVNIYEISSKDIHQFASSICHKIMAISAAHEMMCTGDQNAVSLENIIRRIAKQYGALNEPNPQLLLACDLIEIEPRLVTPLAIIFQELFTNAAKYGALLDEAGQLHVQCKTRNHTSKETRLHLVWHETVCPTSPTTPTAAPASTGQGLGMVKEFTRHELKGTCQFEFEPSGLRFELECQFKNQAAPPTPIASLPNHDPI